MAFESGLNILKKGERCFLLNQFVELINTFSVDVSIRLDRVIKQTVDAELFNSLITFPSLHCSIFFGNLSRFITRG